MNPVASLSRLFPCDAPRLFEALQDRAAWWGEGEAGTEVKCTPGEKLTLEIPLDGAPTRAMLVLQQSSLEPEKGTLLQVLHTRFPDGASRDAHAALWEARLDRLQDRLEALLSGR